MSPLLAVALICLCSRGSQREQNKRSMQHSGNVGAVSLLGEKTVKGRWAMEVGCEVACVWLQGAVRRTPRQQTPETARWPALNQFPPPPFLPSSTSGAASRGLKSTSKLNTPDCSCIRALCKPKHHLVLRNVSESGSEELVILVLCNCKHLYFTKKPTSQQRSETEKLRLRVVTRDWGKWWGRVGERERAGEGEKAAECTCRGRLWLVDEGGGENERGNGKHPFKLKAFCTKNRVHLIHCRHILSRFFFFFIITVLACRGLSFLYSTSGWQWKHEKHEKAWKHEHSRTRMLHRCLAGDRVV